MKLIPLLLAVGSAAPAQIAVRDQQAVPQPTTFDCAADGSVVNSLTGEPIPRAHLSMISGGATSTASADASGKWILSNVACGTASVIVTRPGFLQNSTSPLTLLPASPLHDVKVELTPQSVFYGKVLDDEGDPVVGAQMSVFISRIVNGRFDFQRSGGVATNDLGEYRVAGLARGKYIVCANSSQGLPRAGGLIIAETCYPGPVEGGAASAMEIPAGRESSVNFTLNPSPGVHVRGTVSGVPKGRGPGLNMVKRHAGAGPGGSIASVNNETFDFKVAPGSYTLTADYFEGGKHLLARIPIEVGTADIDNVAVNLDTAFTIEGTVAFESQSGQTAKSQPGVNLRPSEPAAGTAQVKWNAEHTSFVFNDVVPGTYHLETVPPAPFYVKSATLAGQDILNVDLSLSTSIGPIEIVLSDNGGSIEGDIVDGDGQPVQAGILALREGSAVTTRSVGHFKLQNLAPGDYTVYAWDDPSQVPYADTDWMRRNAGSGVAATVTAGQTSAVKLTRQTVPQ